MTKGCRCAWIEGDGLTLVGGLLLWGAGTFGGVGRGYEVGAGGASGGTERAVDLLKLKEHDTLVQGFS